jgi:hypothetical protein
VWELLAITLLSGDEIKIAPRYIVSIIEARAADDPGKHYTDRVRCIITLVDNKTITTEEECDSIERRLHEMEMRK